MESCYFLIRHDGSPQGPPACVIVHDHLRGDQLGSCRAAIFGCLMFSSASGCSGLSVTLQNHSRVGGRSDFEAVCADPTMTERCSQRESSLRRSPWHVQDRQKFLDSYGAVATYSCHASRCCQLRYQEETQSIGTALQVWTNLATQVGVRPQNNSCLLMALARETLPLVS